jgi:ASCH domain
MKALSIRHPWIGAILSGAKTVEVRARPTRHRGDFYLHASGTYGRAERGQLERLRELGHDLPEPDRERLGALVGRARLVDCRLMQPEDWPAALAEPRPGRLWAWVLTGARPLRKPVKVKGQRTLFDVDVP